MAAGDYWEMLVPSQFAQPGPALEELIHQLDVTRRDDPLTFLRDLNGRPAIPLNPNSSNNNSSSSYTALRTSTHNFSQVGTRMRRAITS